MVPPFLVAVAGRDEAFFGSVARRPPFDIEQSPPARQASL
jgi:hypothetical protein